MNTFTFDFSSPTTNVSSEQAIWELIYYAVSTTVSWTVSFLRTVVAPVRWLSFFNAVGIFDEEPSFLRIDVVGYLMRMMNSLTREFGGNEMLSQIFFWPVRYRIFKESMAFLDNQLLINALLFLAFPEYYLREDIKYLDVDEPNLPMPGYPAMIVQLNTLAKQLLFMEAAVEETEEFGLTVWTFVQLWLFSIIIPLLTLIAWPITLPWFSLAFLYIPVGLVLHLVGSQQFLSEEIPLNYSYYCHSRGEYLEVFLDEDEEPQVCPELVDPRDLYYYDKYYLDPKEPEKDFDHNEPVQKE